VKFNLTKIKKQIGMAALKKDQFPDFRNTTDATGQNLA
jgi:hypothetical protein